MHGGCTGRLGGGGLHGELPLRVGGSGGGAAGGGADDRGAGGTPNTAAGSRLLAQACAFVGHCSLAQQQLPSARAHDCCVPALLR